MLRQDGMSITNFLWPSCCVRFHWIRFHWPLHRPDAKHLSSHGSFTDEALAINCRGIRPRTTHVFDTVDGLTTLCWFPLPVTPQSPDASPCTAGRLQGLKDTPSKRPSSTDDHLSEGTGCCRGNWGSYYAMDETWWNVWKEGATEFWHFSVSKCFFWPMICLVMCLLGQRSLLA